MCLCMSNWNINFIYVYVQQKNTNYFITLEFVWIEYSKMYELSKLLFNEKSWPNFSFLKKLTLLLI